MDERKSGPSGPQQSLWIRLGLACVACAMYAITIHPWVLYGNVNEVSLAGGWGWVSDSNVFIPPLLYILTIPVRILPVASQPFVLNILSALLTAGSVYFLASTIRLMPQDRTRDQRIREKSSRGLLTGPMAMIPVIAGTALFIFQMTVWESATLFTRETLNLFIFSVIVWTFFRARLDDSGKLLPVSAFLIGIGLANDGGLIGFLPFFLAAFIWIKKKEFFSFGNLVPVIGSFLAGCLLYLIVPLIHHYNGVDGVGYFERLVSYLGTQKSYILFRGFRIPNFFLSLTSVLPVVFAAVRWPSQFGDMTAIGAFFTQAVFRVFHFIFMVMAFYVSFDLAFSPRESGAQGLLYLRYQFLTCMAAGYYLGYFLLMLGKQGESRRKKRPVLSPQVGNALAWGLAVVALVLPLLLGARNFSKVQARRETPWKPYIQSMADQIKSAGPNLKYVTSNSIFGGNSRRLLMVRTLLPDELANKLVLLDASEGYLDDPTYHAFLKKKHADTYPTPPDLPESQETYSANEITLIFNELAGRSEGMYLNPAFGMFFETVKAYPKAASYLLTPYTRDNINYPVIKAEDLAGLAQFAAEVKSGVVDPLDKLTPELAPKPSQKQPRSRGNENRLMSVMVSGHLNDIGYRLLRSAHYDAAAPYFEMALQLDDSNISARLNQFSMEKLRELNGQTPTDAWALSDEVKEEIGQKLGGIQRLETLLNFYGFLDYPEQTFMLSRTFFENGLPVQAYHLLQRTIELDPLNYQYYADGAMFVLNFGRSDLAENIVDQLRKNVPAEKLDFEDKNLHVKIKAQILQVESSKLRAKGETEEADKLLNQAVSLLLQSAAEEPSRESTLRFLSTVYEHAGQYDMVIENSAVQLERFPDDFRANLQLGLAHAFLGHYQEAIAANNRALEIKADFWEAHKNNAFVYSKLEQWDKAIESLKSMRQLKKNYSMTLLEIARCYVQTGDLDTAKEYYREFRLTLMNGSAEDAALVSEMENVGIEVDEG